MVNIDYGDEFKAAVKKLDKVWKDRIKKQIAKIIVNPGIGKPMKFGRKGTREVYVGSFRFSYSYIKEENKIALLDLYHKDKQ